MKNPAVTTVVAVGFFFGDPSEIRTPDTLIKSVKWNVGALQYIKRVQGEVTRCVVAVFPLCQNLK